MLSEWGIFGIFAVSVLAFYAAPAFYLRRIYRTSDVDVTDVRLFVKRTSHLPVVIKEPHYGDLSIMSFMRVGLEAMLHAFCYGCLVVFSMNLIMWNMPDAAPYEYLLTVVMNHMVNMYMCHIATNGIHVATSHNIHMGYYGFSNIPLVFLWRTPDREYLVPIAAILVILAHYFSRNMQFPEYKEHYDVCHVYTLDDATGEWFWKSSPTSEFGGNKYPKPGVKDYAKWAVAFPLHEIMNTHISSSFTIGVLGGVATSMFVGHSGFFDAGVVSNESLIASVLVAAVVVLAIKRFAYGKSENKMHSLTLSRYHPKVVATLTAMLGAATVIMQLEPFSNGDGATAICYWVSVGALIVNLVLTFAISFWATSQFPYKEDVDGSHLGASMGSVDQVHPGAQHKTEETSLL